MVEGGKIDWACHGNDPATVFEEVIDLDNAVKVAYEFYKKHPKETLIVVTADHETGGMSLGTGRYELRLKALTNQEQSQDASFQGNYRFAERFRQGFLGGSEGAACR